MKTYFASPERAEEQELQGHVDLVGGSAIVSGLMQAVSGLLAVLNEQRQILALNQTLLDVLGVGEAEEVLGLRLGEAIRCVHAQEPPAGCGTTPYCPSCGAAIAMVTSLERNGPSERNCAVEVDRDGNKSDLYLRVLCRPVDLEGQRVLLLFLQDITAHQRRANLERVFFHDINNILNCLVNASELLVMDDGDEKEDIHQRIYRCALRLAREVNMQRSLVQADCPTYEPVVDRVKTREVIEELESSFAEHPVAEHKVLRVEDSVPDRSVRADRYLLIRVLDNMLTNAFEAAPEGGEVKLWVEGEAGKVTFCVWNREPVPEGVRNRVFQRNISNKPGIGRGIGTYSMKLFGEEYLGGKVDFTTSEADGTTFRFSLNDPP